ncbi:MAG: SDR family oxidoreductase [Saprospiraceae bacterium]|nr:SDR family oxidoreductase [Saprospiraceae bacterium]MCF8250272.1 SDR family oxidoreductase [Saprospiraceae bacterium]MCF8312096.1 SDR family oxidoreductase [Saprospiraceae bacterium]MCF8440503.1 SDR family oxidoreductase [Saprospiraceae bacterium]
MMKIIITGATKGIGRAIAEKFASEGFDVAVCARSEADLATFKKDFEGKYGVEVLTKSTDMRKKTEVLAFADFVRKHWGEVDCLVNNAGIFLPGSVQEEADGALENMMETNLYSAYHFTRALLPTMLAKGSGHIFNMCSIASQIAYPNGGSYSISKFALLGFSKVLREELKTKGIKVTAILPGATWSDSWAGADFPESRLMQASDIAIAVWAAWQMSPAAVVEEIVVRPQLGDL